MNHRRSGIREDWPKWPSGFALLRLPNTCASWVLAADGCNQFGDRKVPGQDRKSRPPSIRVIGPLACLSSR